MPPVPAGFAFDFIRRTTGPFGQLIRDGFAARGWNPADLDAFRMEDGNGGGAGDGSGGAGGGDGSGAGGGGSGSGDDDLGDAGKKALAEERSAKKAAEKAAREALARAEAAEKRAKELEDANASDEEKKLAAAKAEGAAEAKRLADEERAAATAATNLRLLKAEVKAAAGTKLADPNDAVAHFIATDKLDEFVDDDGEVDTEAIATAIDQLLKDKPYLAAKAGSGGGGGFDGGARDDSKTSGLAAGRERAKAEREAREAKQRDPFAGMTVAGRSGTT